MMYLEYAQDRAKLEARLVKDIQNKNR
jgi:hypothetical protein